MPKQGVELLTDDFLAAVETRRQQGHVLDDAAVIRALTYALDKINKHALDVQDGRKAA